MKFKKQIFLLSLVCITLNGCTPPSSIVTIDEEIDYSKEVELT
jgi:hypothetical protein